MTITAERLHELLNWDPTTGLFVWLGSRGLAHVGAVAGGLNNQGYRLIMIDRQRYMAHRLAWLWVYGEWPAKRLDHINGNRADNRIANLREATQSQNMANRGAQCNNTSGRKGVTRFRNGYRAQIRVNGKTIHLGLRSTGEEAFALYCAAAERFFGEFGKVE